MGGRVKVNFYENNRVRIIAKYVAPGSCEIKMDGTFTKVVNDGENRGGAFFYWALL